MNKKKMSLEEKVGQVFTIRVDGHQINGDIIHMLNAYHVGGVYYTDENVKRPKQVNQLSYQLQNYSDSIYPLFIATKQNGAELNTITKETTAGIKPDDLGHLRNRVYTKRMTSYIGQELYGMGINMNIGPMLHADKKDAYSYSEEVDIVGKQGRAAIEGYHAAQVLAVADSFPTNLEILHSDAPIYKTALHPFQYVIEHGVQAIATEDAATTADILRGKLDFQGLIIQDYTETAAAYDQVINAIRAGANMIVLNDTYRAQMNIMNAVMDAVKTDVIAESTLDTALERVYAVKESFTIKDVVPFNRDLFNNKKSITFMKQMEKKLEQTTITT